LLFSGAAGAVAGTLGATGVSTGANAAGSAAAFGSSFGSVLLAAVGAGAAGAVFSATTSTGAAFTAAGNSAGSAGIVSPPGFLNISRAELSSRLAEVAATSTAGAEFPTSSFVIACAFKTAQFAAIPSKIAPTRIVSMPENALFARP
jgi:hypothetical protein